MKKNLVLILALFVLAAIPACSLGAIPTPAVVPTVQPIVLETPTVEALATPTVAVPAGVTPMSPTAVPTPTLIPTPEPVNWAVFKTPNGKYQIAVDQRVLAAAGGEVDIVAWEKALDKVSEGIWTVDILSDSPKAGEPFPNKEFYLRTYKANCGFFGGRVVNSHSIYAGEERDEFLHQITGDHTKYWGLALHYCMVFNEGPCHPWSTAFNWLILEQISQQWPETWVSAAGGQDLSPAIEAGRFLQTYRLFPNVDYGLQWWEWGQKYRCAVKDDCSSMIEPVEDGQQGDIDWDNHRRANEVRAGDEVECYIVPGIHFGSGFEKTDPFCMRVEEQDFISFVYLEGSCLEIDE